MNPTSPRILNNELFPQPLGPHTSTFIPDLTYQKSKSSNKRDVFEKAPNKGEVFSVGIRRHILGKGFEKDLA
jgi:hypothetical protein